MHRCILTLIAAAAAASAQPSLSSLAAGVLDQTHQARQAVAAHDRGAAMGHVRRAIATIDEIQRNARNAAQPLLVPVYREVETTSTVTPVKKHDEFEKLSSIRGVDGETTTAQLDVTAAGNRLPAAQSALDSSDWSAADAALAAVENSVSVTQTTGEMPLRMARQNLELARARVLNGKYRDAELPLKSAAQALGEYEKRVSGRQAADIEEARQAILGFSTHVTHERDTALGRIDSWMDMLRQWSSAQ